VSEKFAILYADPPWEYGRQQFDGNRGADTGGAESHYPTMPLARLKRLRVADLAEPDALLFLWATSPLLDQAVDLMKAWGFEYMTVGFVWDKVKVNPGYYTMSQCELCLVGKRGRIPSPRGARNIRQLVVAPRGAHSAKPEEVRKRIEAMFPRQRKVELFARRRVPGWHAWGNEVRSTVQLPAGGRPSARNNDRSSLR
jgi:N6-adenosine-specific RNA methylase IME4